LKVNCELNHCGASTELSPLAVSDTVVPGTTLDEHYRNRELVFDFIKIDAHGAEPSIFAGAQDFLRRCTTASAIFAVQFRPGNDAIQFVDGLLQTGFYAWQLSQKGDLRRLTSPGDLDRGCNTELILSRNAEALRRDSPSIA
jgi:hypothetical protein